MAEAKKNFIKLINNIDTIDPITIKLIPGEFSQVLINIFNNAKDSIIDNKIKDPHIILDLKLSNDTVLLSIEDNAGGISEEILDKIFEPYFTTKTKGKGTGLGLHMSQKIISESFKGKLYAQNVQNGARFVIELPL